MPLRSIILPPLSLATSIIAFSAGWMAGEMGTASASARSERAECKGSREWSAKDLYSLCLAMLRGQAKQEWGHSEMVAEGGMK